MARKSNQELYKEGIIILRWLADNKEIQTRDLADRFDIPMDMARRRLKRLVNQGLVRQYPGILDNCFHYRISREGQNVLSILDNPEI